MGTGKSLNVVILDRWNSVMNNLVIDKHSIKFLKKETIKYKHITKLRFSYELD